MDTIKYLALCSLLDLGITICCIKIDSIKPYSLLLRMFLKEQVESITACYNMPPSVDRDI